MSLLRILRRRLFWKNPCTRVNLHRFFSFYGYLRNPTGKWSKNDLLWCTLAQTFGPDTYHNCHFFTFSRNFLQKCTGTSIEVYQKYPSFLASRLCHNNLGTWPGFLRISHTCKFLEPPSLLQSMRFNKKAYSSSSSCFTLPPPPPSTGVRWRTESSAGRTSAFSSADNTHCCCLHDG